MSRLALAIGLVLTLVIASAGAARAAVSVTAASGGTNLAVGQWAALTGPTLDEGSAGDTGVGTIVLALPTGFVFDTAASAVTATVTDRGRCSGGHNRPLRLGTSSLSTRQTVTAQSGQVTVNVAQRSAGSCVGTITWSGLRVRATQPASGVITSSGTSAIVGVSVGYNWGVLTTAVTPTPTATATPTPSATATPTPSATRTPTPGGTPGPPGSPTATAPPGGVPATNDNGANAIVLPVPGSASADVSAATLESWEYGACGPIGHTVWYRITAPSSGYLVVTTAGSDFDTMLIGRYDAAAGSVLGCNDDVDGTLQSRFRAYVESGRSYYVQVGGFADHAGRLQVQVAIEAATPTATATATALANDAFANAAALALPGTVSGNSSLATTETGEPSCPYSSSGRTHWYRLAPAADGVLTAVSSGAGFDTQLALYSGSSVGSLTRLACGENYTGAGRLEQRLSTGVRAGQTYYLQLGGYGGSGGGFSLRAQLDPPLVNDAFAGATALAVPSETLGVTQAATVETGEPTSCRTPGGGSVSYGRTVWYKVVPSRAGTLLASTQGSSFNSVIAVYTGSGLGSLTQVGCNDQDFSQVGPALVSAPVVADQTYYLQIGGWNAGGATIGEAGDLKLDLSLGPPPPNDRFDAAAQLTVPGSASGDTTWATFEDGESISCGYNPIRTVWYRMTPSQSGLLTASVSQLAGRYEPVVAIYTGSALGGLTKVACGGRPLSADVIAGQTYYLQAAGDTGTSGTYTLDVSLQAGPANDSFASASALAVPTAIPIDTTAATLEPGEPRPACNRSGDKTVWYRVTPSGSGTLVVSTSGATFDTFLAAYSGSTLDGLTPLACTDAYSKNDARISLAVAAGQTYYVQLGGVYAFAATGQLTLNSALVQPPINDDFGSASALALPGSASGSNEGATLERGEPGWSDRATKTVWYRLTPPQAGRLTASTAGSAFAATLGLYRGTIVDHLSSDGTASASGGGAAAVSVDVRAGETYYLQVGGYDQASGSFQLAVSLDLPPGNDAFAGATALDVPVAASMSSWATQISATNWAATSEPAEPPFCYTPDLRDPRMSKSLWYRIAPTTSGQLRLNAQAVSHQVPLGLYSGNALPALRPLACVSDGYLKTPVSAGQTYYLQVAGEGNASSRGSWDITLQGSIDPPLPPPPPGGTRPANDNVGTASEVPVPGTLSGTSAGASVEPGEDVTTCDRVWTTVWFRVAVPATGRLRLAADGSAIDTRLAVFAGAPGSLTRVGCGTGSGASAPVIGGQSYYVQLATVSGNGTAYSLRTWMELPPDNDAFAGAAALAAPGSATGSSVAATQEPGELHLCGLNGGSIWFRIEPTVSGMLTASSAGSSYTSVLTIHQGASLLGLVPLACGNDVASGGGARASAYVYAGQTYYLQLGGWTYSAEGNYAIQTSLAPDAPPPTPTADSTQTRRVSLSPGGGQANDESAAARISADGRYVVFTSKASNLVAGDANELPDVVLRDLQAASTTRVSIGTGGLEPNGGWRALGASAPSISGDGRYVAFASQSDNLVADDTNHASDVFVRDMATGAVTRVSVSTSGLAANAASDAPSISRDGRYVAFRSWATNLIDGRLDSWSAVYVRDLATGTTTLVSVPSPDGPAFAEVREPAISADGRVVAFSASATYWRPAADGVSWYRAASMEVFARDLPAGETTLLSKSSAGEIGLGDSAQPAISADGRFVAFSSAAENLIAGDTNRINDVFRHDRATGTTARVSLSSDGAQGTASYGSYDPAISADGRYIAFASYVHGLAPGDSSTDQRTDVFLRDVDQGTTARLSVAADGGRASSSSGGPSLSADAGRLAFVSWASDLVAGDLAYVDVFVRDVAPPPAPSTP